MANHCIDLICLNCGHHWCDRGCGEDNKQVDADYLSKFNYNKQQWADYHNNGVLSIVMASGSYCYVCKSTQVAHD